MTTYCIFLHPQVFIKVESMSLMVALDLPHVSVSLIRSYCKKGVAYQPRRSNLLQYDVASAFRDMWDIQRTERKLCEDQERVDE